MRILVFLHGTTIMHAGGAGRTAAERVRQVQESEASVSDFSSYIPIGNAAAKLRAWEAMGAELAYLSSHTNHADVAKDEQVLHKHKFPDGPVYWRMEEETYGDVVERAAPDVLIEDNCESIGGANEMVYPHLPASLGDRLKGVVVGEFASIDDLNDDPALL